MAQRYFLAFLTFTSCSAAIEKKYALKGQQVSLKPDITEGHADILWKFNGNKAIEFDGKEELVFDPFENRITLAWLSAELTISNLSFEDSGQYELELFRENKLHNFNYKLEVIDSVAKPTISCEMNNGGGSNVSGTLACAAEPRQPESLMRFEWSSHGGVQPGPQLIISLGQKHDDEVYSCRVSNPLSSETASFTAKHCYPENSSGALIAGVVSAVILLLLIVVIVGVVICRQTRRACFAKGTGNNSKNQSAPHAPDRSDKETSQGDKITTPLDGALTPPSTQPLGQDSANKSPEEPASNDGEDADSDPDTGKGLVQNRKEKFEQMIRRQTEPKNLPTGSEAAQGDKTARPTPSSTKPLSHGSVNKRPKESATNHNEVTDPDLDAGKGSDKETQDDETTPLLDGTPTSPSTQPLGQDSANKSPEEPASNDGEDADSDPDTGKGHDIDSDDEKPLKGSEKEIETTPLDGAPTPTQPLGQDSVNKRPEEPASNDEGDTDSDLYTGKDSDDEKPRKEREKNIERNNDELIVAKNLPTGSEKEIETTPLDGAPTPTQPLGQGSVNKIPEEPASNDEGDTDSDLYTGKGRDIDSEDEKPQKEREKNIERNNDELIVAKNLPTETTQGGETAHPTPPATQKLGQDSANMMPEEPASNHEEDTNSDPDAGKGKSC